MAVRTSTRGRLKPITRTTLSWNLSSDNCHCIRTDSKILYLIHSLGILDIQKTTRLQGANHRLTEPLSKSNFDLSNSHCLLKVLYLIRQMDTLSLIMPPNARNRAGLRRTQLGTTHLTPLSNPLDPLILPLLCAMPFTFNISLLTSS